MPLPRQLVGTSDLTQGAGALVLDSEWKTLPAAGRLWQLPIPTPRHTHLAG